MADEGSAHSVPAAFYDVHEGDRFDLDPYIAVAAGPNARTVVVIGCDIGLAPKVADLGLVRADKYVRAGQEASMGSGRHPT